MKFLNPKKRFKALNLRLLFGFFCIAIFYHVSTWENDLFQTAHRKTQLTQLLVNVLNRAEQLSVVSETNFDAKVKKYRQLFNLTNPGDMGEAVVLPKELPDEVKKLIDDGWKDYTINQFVSDLVPLRRSLPDIRGDYCKKQVYENLPKASVIIIFHNEAWSMVKR